MQLSSPVLNEELRRYCVCLNADKNTAEGIAGLHVSSISLPPNVVGLAKARPSPTRLYIMSPEGRVLDTFRTQDDAGIAQVIARRVRAHARALGVQPDNSTPDSRTPAQAAGSTRPRRIRPSDLTLFVTSRLVAADTDEARGRPFKLHPTSAGDFNDDMSHYFQYRLQTPTGEWIVLSESRWRALLPSKATSIGATWSLPSATATALLLRFRAPAHLSDLRAEDMHQIKLDATLVSRDSDTAVVRLTGYVSAIDTWTGQQQVSETRFVAQSSVVGYVRVDLRKRAVRSLELVTLKDAALCGPDGTSLPYVSVMSMR